MNTIKESNYTFGAMKRSEFHHLFKKVKTKSVHFTQANNHFEFKRAFYHHVLGIAIDRKLAPLYADLFMSKIEDKYVYTYPQ